MTKDEEIAALKHAFEMFSQSSDTLSRSYEQLQEQVSILSQKLAGVELARQEEQQKNKILVTQFHQLIESMPVGVLLLDGEGCISLANSAALTLFGFPLVGMPWSEVVPRSFSPQKDDGHEVSMVTGKRVRVETASLGNLPGQMLIFVDLTETFKLQRQLSHHERLSNMGKMVAALAHQIRTPLSSAILYAGHLQKADLSPEHRQKFAGKLMGRLENIERQIRDMLVFSRSEIRLDQSIAVTDFVKELADLAVDICVQKNVEFCVVSPPEFSGSIRCNKETLQGALLNLLNNAVEASGAGEKVTMAATIRDSWLEIDFTDQGKGMSQEQLDNVQQGFVTTKQHGTGLGLMVVKAVARAHHGEFEIQSELRKGTRAGMKIPLLKV